MTDDHASLIAVAFEKLDRIAAADGQSAKLERAKANLKTFVAEALSASARALAEVKDRVVDLEHDCEELTHANTRLLERAQAAEASLAAARAAALEEAVERVRQTCFAMGLPSANALVFIHDLHALSPQAEPAWVNGRVRRLFMYVCQECGAIDDASAEAIQHQPHCSIQSPLRTPEGRGS